MARAERHRTAAAARRTRRAAGRGDPVGTCSRRRGSWRGRQRGARRRVEPDEDRARRTPRGCTGVTLGAPDAARRCRCRRRRCRCFAAIWERDLRSRIGVCRGLRSRLRVGALAASAECGRPSRPRVHRRTLAVDWRERRPSTHVRLVRAEAAQDEMPPGATRPLQLRGVRAQHARR